MRFMARMRLGIGVVLGLIATLLLGLGLVDIVAPLDIDALRRSGAVPSSVIVDRQGRQLYEIIDSREGAHRAVPLESVPLVLRQAIIATEDASFYDNPGFSPRAILRALRLNLLHGEVVSGASTMTQQLARQLFLYDRRYEQSLSRKLHETWLAYRLTRVLSKDEILTLYLNETSFGNMAYGVNSAAWVYFDKPVSDLNLAESALLAGLPQSPTAYNPLIHPEAAKARQGIVLDLMAHAGYISQAEAARAFREPLRFGGKPFSIQAPHFVMAVREELTRVLGEETVTRGGLEIRTTLDLGLQQKAESQARRHLDDLNKATTELSGHHARNAAAVALAPDGAVRVMVGSPDYFDATIAGAVNASMALRQPGSALKPFTYAAAFERGMSPATVVSDVRTVFQTHENEPYVPVNYDRRFHGPVSLREALACSYNVVAVRVLDRIGIHALPDMVRRVGVETLNQPERQGLALTLGSCEVRLIDLTAAYGALANGGRRVDPYLISEVLDQHGDALYRHRTPEPEPVIDARVAYLVTDILADDAARILAFGPGNLLELPFPAAAKTGTTTDWRDNWTLGYSTEWTVGVWVGNADGTPMHRATGITGAAPIWNSLMRLLHQRAPAPFERPDGLAETQVCAHSGLVPGPACAHRKHELFLAENIPTETCEMHQFMVMDALTGQPADEGTPEERRVMRTVTYWPEDALEWAIDQGLPVPPDMMAVADDHLAAAQVDGEMGFGERLYLSTPDQRGIYRISPDLPEEHQQLQVSAVCSQCQSGDMLELMINQEVWHTWSKPPYRVLWPLAPGEHTFTLVLRSPRRDIVMSPSTEISVVVDTLGRGERP